MITLYTDGSTSSNPGLGSFACLLIDGESRTLYLKKSKNETTSNRAELAAMVIPMEVLAQFKDPITVRILTDSKYVEENFKKRLRNWIHTNGRKHDGKEVANFDLWKRLYAQSLKHILTIEWRPSHSGVWENELVDYAAKAILKYEPDLSLVPPDIKVEYL